FEVPTTDSMTGFVVCDNLFFCRGNQFVLFLQSPDDFIQRVIEIFHIDRLLISASGNQGCFVAHIGYFSPCKSRRHFSQFFSMDIVCNFDVLEVDIENLPATVEVGAVDADLPIESTGTQKRTIQYIGPVGSSHQNNAFFTGESVHFDQQLVEGVFPFVVASLDAVSAPGSSDGIYFIDKNDTRSFFPGLAE